MASACFIIGAGPFYGLPVAPGPEDVVLAADGGYRHCQTAGITPDLLLYTIIYVILTAETTVKIFYY